MLFKFILALVVFGWVSPTHDLPIGITTIHMESNQLTVELKFEKEDLAKALAVQSAQELAEKEVKAYVQSHTQLSINDQKLKLRFDMAEGEAEHYLLKAQIDQIPAPAKTMRIQNTCLVQEISKHSNIIYLNYKDKRRGFRLHKDRLFTEFEL